MGSWTKKKIKFRADSNDVVEKDGVLHGEGTVELDECPFSREVQDEAGNVVRVECVEGTAVKFCDPDSKECNLQQWMDSVKAFIRRIDVDDL
ncbi:MAG: hypothetical protein JRJ12_07435 [Deltaproteobacteria bacterium]|nr:hypothetical protein [Deltaproteobacteria bacterium]MBW2071288.1 hypothetical protein [Deltaproteobacteria bacterium]